MFVSKLMYVYNSIPWYSLFSEYQLHTTHNIHEPRVAYNEKEQQYHVHIMITLLSHKK
jgi:hypothetical protein